MTPGELQDTLFAHGWSKDRWGNFKKEFEGKTRRIKLQALSARLEVYSTEIKEWVRLSSGYYKDLELGEFKGAPAILNRKEKKVWRL